MLFIKEDKILIKNLFELKGYNAQHLVSKFPSIDWNTGSVYKLLQKLPVTVSVDRCYGSAADDTTPSTHILITLILLTNWHYTK